VYIYIKREREEKEIGEVMKYTPFAGQDTTNPVQSTPEIVKGK
jgi:hypothetical protein